MSQCYWSALLSGTALIGLHLAGRQNPAGWALCILDEMLWIAYAIATAQWPFIASALAYTWVYYQNLRRWRHTVPAHPARHRRSQPPAGRPQHPPARPGDPPPEFWAEKCPRPPKGAGAGDGVVRTAFLAAP